MPVDNQYLNLCSRYVQAVEDLKALVGRFRGLRTEADLLGYSSAAMLSTISFPLPGDLAHVTTPDQFLSFLAGVESLFNALLAPVNYTGADGTQKNTLTGTAILKLGR